jgi:predicted chitinase
MDEEKQILLAMLDELRAMRDQSSILGTSRMPGAASTPSENTIKYFNRLGNTAGDVDKELEELGYSSRGLTRAQIDQLKAAHEYEKKLKTQAEALKAGTGAIKDFSKELLSQKAGFEKYGKSVEGFTGAIGQFLSTFGLLGKALGATVDVVGKLSSVYMEQADRVLKANDQLAKFGTAGSFTSKELLQMAHGANLTSKNLELFTKPIASMGSNMMLLGKNTGDSVKAFADLAKISYQQREEYQRLGVSQEELLQTQADYVALQSMAGRNLKAEMKDRAALQRASLEYQDTLLELATLTGQDVEAVKKKQQEASRAVEWQISQIQLENKARKLEAEGRTEEAKKLRDEAKARQQTLDRISALGNETVTKGARSFLATGTISGEEAQALTRMGLMEDLTELRQAIQNGADVQQATSKFQDAYNKKFGETIDNVGFAAQISKEVARLFGISESALEKFNQQRDTNFKEANKAEKDRIEAAKKAGKDPSQDARAALTTYEQKFGKFVDNLVAEANPLLSGFNSLTIAATLAAAALGALALGQGSKILGGLASRGKDAIDAARGAARGGLPGTGGTVSPGGGGGGPKLPGVNAEKVITGATTVSGAASAASAATSAGTALANLAGPLSKLASAAPVVSTAAAVGGGVVDIYQGIKAAEKELKEGKITKEEAREKKGEAVGGGVGAAAAGTGGALAGAKAGAVLGAAGGPIGIAIGGIIGAAVGGWLGSKGGKAIGEAAGGSIAKMTDNANKEIDKAKKEISEKKNEEGIPITINGKLAGRLTDEGIIAEPGQAEALRKAQENLRKQLGEQNPFTVQRGIGSPNETSDGIFGRLSTSSRELSGTFEEFTKILDTALEDMGSTGASFTKFDNRIKKIPENIEEAMEDALRAGVGDTSRLREALKSESSAPDSSANTSAPSAPSAPPSVKQDVKQNLGEVKAALMKRGVTDSNYLNAVLGNVMKESGGKVINENLDYSKTKNERIRSIFGSRAAGKTDEELNRIKSNPESMGEFMYGKDTAIGKRMGNLEPGDGWKYRGRGYIQLTGKSNYASASRAIFGDDRLVKNPDLVNDPKIAADVVAWYMERSKTKMATKMGFDERNMTQEQANLLATSQIAGIDVRKAGGFLANETMQKVSSYSSSGAIQGIRPSADTMVAGVNKDKIPKAEKGGVFEGPESGYIVELHGNETVIPTEKIASIAKKSVKLFSDEMGPTAFGVNEYTGFNQGNMTTDLTAIQKIASKIGAYDEKTKNITDTDAWKSILHSGIATNYQLGPATVGTKAFGGDVGDILGDRLQEMINEGNTVNSSVEKLAQEFRDALTTLVDKLIPNIDENIGNQGNTGSNSMSEVVDLLGNIAEKISQSNSIQDKLLQVSRI